MAFAYQRHGIEDLLEENGQRPDALFLVQLVGAEFRDPSRRLVGLEATKGVRLKLSQDIVAGQAMRRSRERLVGLARDMVIQRDRGWLRSAHCRRWCCT